MTPVQDNDKKANAFGTQSKEMFRENHSTIVIAVLSLTVFQYNAFL